MFATPLTKVDMSMLVHPEEVVQVWTEETRNSVQEGKPSQT